MRTALQKLNRLSSFVVHILFDVVLDLAFKAVALAVDLALTPLRMLP